MNLDLRERVARAIARPEQCGSEENWQEFLPNADAVLSELAPELVAYVGDAGEVRETDFAPQPQPQASAEPTISEVLAEYERQTKELPCQHEVPERGCCSYNWRTAIIGELRAIADEAKRIRASLEVGK